MGAAEDPAATSERLETGDQADEGDLLQLSYLAAGRSHGVILSIDGRGAVTLHWPDRRGGATALVPSGEVRLDHAYELDDAPGFERFFLVTGADALDVNAILDAAEDLAADADRARDGALALAEGLEQRSVLLLKERR